MGITAAHHLFVDQFSFVLAMSSTKYLHKYFVSARHSTRTLIALMIKKL